MLCMEATFVKKNSCLVVRIASLISHTHPQILNLISVTLSHINDIIIVPPITSSLNQYFQVSQLLKCDGNMHSISIKVKLISILELRCLKK